MTICLTPLPSSHNFSLKQLTCFVGQCEVLSKTLLRRSKIFSQMCQLCLQDKQHKDRPRTCPYTLKILISTHQSKLSKKPLTSNLVRGFYLSWFMILLHSSPIQLLLSKSPLCCFLWLYQDWLDQMLFGELDVIAVSLFFRNIA